MAFDFTHFQERSLGFLKNAKERMVELKDKLEPKVEKAAESAAKKVTEINPAVRRPPRKSRRPQSWARSDWVWSPILASSGGVGLESIGVEGLGDGLGGGGGDVMDEAGRFFAENGGSLNIETHVVDMDGCLLS